MCGGEVGIGMLLIGLTLIASLLHWRGVLFAERWLLWDLGLCRNEFRRRALRRSLEAHVLDFERQCIFVHGAPISSARLAAQGDIGEKLG